MINITATQLPTEAELILKKILPLTQEDLSLIIRKTLRKLKIRHTTDYKSHILVKTGEVKKPLICVHLDTINTASKGVLKSEDIIEVDRTLKVQPYSKARCLGGDDRCGVAITITLLCNLDTFHKYHYAFFFDEEVGCIGSSDWYDEEGGKEFVEKYVSCFIGLDRRNTIKGVPEYALYGYDNDELNNHFEGYDEAIGSITDASCLASLSNKACLNLSVGYNNEHTTKEYIHIPDMLCTLNKLIEVTINKEYYKPTYKIYDDYSYYSKRGDKDFCYGGNFDVVGMDDVPFEVDDEDWGVRYTQAEEMYCKVCGSDYKLYSVFDRYGQEDIIVCEKCCLKMGV